MSYSTVKCHICGTIGEPTPKLEIICPNGHKSDQDFQACKNLLGSLPEELFFDKKGFQPPVPPHLTDYIIKCN